VSTGASRRFLSTSARVRIEKPEVGAKIRIKDEPRWRKKENEEKVHCERHIVRLIELDRWHLPLLGWHLPDERQNSKNI
jgi:hypothetical protein